MEKHEITLSDKEKMLKILSIILAFVIVVIIVILAINFKNKDKYKDNKNEPYNVTTSAEAIKLVREEFNLTNEKMTTTEDDNYFFVAIEGNNKEIFTVSKNNGTVKRREVKTNTVKVSPSEAG